MSGPPVTVVESGGLPVRQVDSGAPVLSAVESGGTAITLSDHGTPFVVLGIEAGAVTFSGARLTVVGDSRQDNGVTAIDNGAGKFTSTTPMKVRLRSVPGWMNHTLGYKTRITGARTYGGSKTSEHCHDAALAAIAATNPDHINVLLGTNDPIDYTGTGGLGPVALGDPDADPSTLARVGATAPVSPGTGTQGTTLGNIDKFLRYFEALDVPVVWFELPTENASRTQRNADIHKFLMKHKALGTYSNLIAPNLYDVLLATPGADDGATATGIWRTDLNATVGVISGNGGDRLHPSASGARFLGETLAADPDIVAAVAGLSSQMVAPTGANNPSFLNSNPYLDTQSGGTTMAGTGTTPTGTICSGYRVRNNIPATGTSSVTCSATPGGHGQRISITRTGGSGTTARVVDFRTADFSRALVAGDTFELVCEVVIPARAAGDLYGIAGRVNYFESGMVDAAGNSVATGAFEVMGITAPDPFPLDGDTTLAMTCQFIVTPAMVASATGNVVLTGIIEASIPDNLDTAANGALTFDVLRCGFRKVA